MTGEHKMRNLLAVTIASIFTLNAGAFDRVSSQCPASIQVERDGELRRFSYCEKANDPSTCSVIGERGWYTVSDLAYRKNSRKRDSIIWGVMAAGSAAVTGVIVATAPFSGGVTLLVASTFGAATVGYTVLTVKVANLSASLAQDFVDDKEIRTKDTCGEMQKFAADLKYALEN